MEERIGLSIGGAMTIDAFDFRGEMGEELLQAGGLE